MSVKEALGSFSYLYDWGFTALMVILLGSIVYEIFKTVVGRSTDYIGLFIKFTLLVSLYVYSAPVINFVVGDILSFSSAESQKDQLSLTIGKFFVSLGNAWNDTKAQGDERTKDEGRNLFNFFGIGNDLLSLKMNLEFFITKMILLGVLLFFLSVTLIGKMVMLDIVWPVVYQLALIGFVFAAVFAALPGGGTALKKFFTLLVQVALWPVIYSLAFTVVADAMNRNIEELQQTITANMYTSLDAANAGAQSGAATEAMTASLSHAAYFWTNILFGNIHLILLFIAYCIFLAAIAFFVPKLAAMIVNSESAAAVGGMMGLAVGRAMTSVGQASALAGGALLSGVGSSLLQAGSSMSTMGAATLNKVGANLSSGGEPSMAASAARSVAGALDTTSSALDTGSRGLTKLGDSARSSLRGEKPHTPHSHAPSASPAPAAASPTSAATPARQHPVNLKGLSAEQSYSYSQAKGMASPGEAKQMQGLHRAINNTQQHSPEKIAGYKEQLYGLTENIRNRQK